MNKIKTWLEKHNIKYHIEDGKIVIFLQKDIIDAVRDDNVIKHDSTITIYQDKHRLYQYGKVDVQGRTLWKAPTTKSANVITYLEDNLEDLINAL